MIFTSNKSLNEINETGETVENYKISSKPIFNSLVNAVNNFELKNENDRSINYEESELKVVEDFLRSRNIPIPEDSKEKEPTVKSQNREVQTSTKRKLPKVNEASSREDDRSKDNLVDTRMKIYLPADRSGDGSRENFGSSQQVLNSISKVNYKNSYNIPPSTNRVDNNSSLVEIHHKEKIYQSKSSHNFFNKNISDYQTKVNNSLLSKALEKNKYFVQAKVPAFKPYFKKVKKTQENPILIKKLEFDNRYNISNMHYDKTNLANQELASINTSFINRNLLNNSEIDGKTVYYAEINQSSLPISHCNSILPQVANIRHSKSQQKEVVVDKIKLQNNSNNRTLDPNFFLKNKVTNINNPSRYAVYKNYMNFKTNSEVVKLGRTNKKTKSMEIERNEADYEKKLKISNDDKDLKLFKKIVDQYNLKYNNKPHKLADIKRNSGFNESNLDFFENTSNNEDYEFDIREHRNSKDGYQSKEQSKLQSLLKTVDKNVNLKIANGFHPLEKTYKNFKERVEDKASTLNLMKLKKTKTQSHFDEANKKIIKDEMRTEKYKAGDIGVSYNKKNEEYRQIEYAIYKQGMNLKKNLNRGVTEILCKVMGRENLEKSLKYID